MLHQKKDGNTRAGRGHHAVRRVLLLLLLLTAVLLAAAAPTIRDGYDLYRGAIAALPLDQAVQKVRAKADYTTLDALPDIYKAAVISTEDRRFYWHIGIDPIAIVRAAVKDIAAQSFDEGGSTITQQLAKNLYFTQEKKFSRKIAEVFVAFDLERNYTKDEILELYVNSIYYGSGYNSVAAASEGYFGKTPSEMTDAECTLLAGLPNAPSAYSPHARPDLALARQAQVLKALVRDRKLTQAQADAILADSKASLEE